MKNKDDKNRVVYSTNPNYKPREEGASDNENISASQQTLYISLERLKGGKIATIVADFIGSESELEQLGKQLKSKCGVGGTVKDGIILIQGEQREKIIGILNSMGYKTKRKGG